MTTFRAMFRGTQVNQQTNSNTNSVNIFADVFNEALSNNKDVTPYDTRRPIFGSIIQNSSNNPYPNKPAISATGTANLYRYINYAQLGIRNNENFRVRVQCHYAGTGSFYIDLRNSAGTVLQSYQVLPVSTTGFCDFVSPAFQGRSDAFEILVRLQSSSGNARELFAIAVGKGDATPSINVAPNPLPVLRDMANAKNLCPDPFFRRYLAGETSIDGYALGQVNNFSIVDYSASPFKGRKAQFYNTSSFQERFINISRLGLKLGKTYKVGMGVIAPTGGNFGIMVYLRNSSNNAIIGGTQSDTDYTLADGVYMEVFESITVTQEILDTPCYLVIRHNSNNIAFAGGYNICGWFIYESLDQELIDDEFAFDTLASRVVTLENSLTATPNQEGEWRLRETRQRTRKILAGDTEQLSYVCMGHSWVQLGSRFSTPLAEQLIADFGDAGGGWLGFGFTGSLVNGNVRSSSYTYSRTGSWTSAYNTGLSVDLSTVTSSTAGDRLTLGGPAGTPLLSGIDLHYVGTADGVIRYSWNSGGSWTSLNVGGTLGEINIAALSGFPTSGNYSLIIEVVSGTVTLCGLNIKSNNKGVVVHKLGGSGSRLEHWASINSTQFKNALLNLNPRLFSILHLSNDLSANRTSAQFTADLTTVVTRVREAIPSCDIMIAMPPCDTARTIASIAPYVTGAYNVAKANDCAFLNLQGVFGTDPAQYANGSARSWYNADGIHPDPLTGGRAILDAFYRFIRY